MSISPIDNYTLKCISDKYHWFNYIPEEERVELFLDHHALSTYRRCEALFELSILNKYRPKVGRSWSLEFGIAFHAMIEEFYKMKKSGEYETGEFVNRIVNYWAAKSMNDFSEHKMYRTLGGLQGFVLMLIQYSEHFAQEADRLRVLGIEIPFGKNREVCLGAFYPNSVTVKSKLSVTCYLTGRLDFLMDSGNAIGPLDHKTTAYFKSNTTDSYDPQEGMTGYVYATKYVIKNLFPELLAQRKVDRIWLNFASVTPDKDNNPMNRFKRIPIFKTDWQLEQYRSRQIVTFQKIYKFITSPQPAEWNTSTCTGYYNSDCMFKSVHRQNSSQNMLTILNNDFTTGEEWNPERV